MGRESRKEVRVWDEPSSTWSPGLLSRFSPEQGHGSESVLHMINYQLSCTVAVSNGDHAHS
jgi:hypothetical protein